MITDGVMMMTSAKPMVFRASTSATIDGNTLSHLIIRPAGFGGSANVGIGTNDPKSKLSVDGGVQVGDDQATTSLADKVGTFRYHEILSSNVKGSNSYVDMVMRTGNGTYEWVNIVTNNW